MPGSHKVSFNALKNLNCPNKPTKSWSIFEMYAEESELDLLEMLADFFNSISSEFEPVSEVDIPVTYDREILKLDPITIENMLRKIKKPKSMVPGDIPPNLVTILAKELSVPLAQIFNAMPISSWPSKWKKEYQTVIPK